jgi:CsoR family transcriptional regulator, copper-sensing transcriptional repressor
MNSCKEHQHPDYIAHLPRLNRIEGQIQGIKKMIGERRYCPDIIMQLKAIRAACQSIEALMLETHLDSCVVDAFHSDNEANKNEKIQELTKLYKK